MSPEKPSILIVEDNDDDFEIIERACKKIELKHPLYRCVDGDEGMDFLFKENQYTGEGTPRPAIVILDLNMPKLDGRAMLKKIKENEEFKELVTIVLTTSNDLRDIRECYRLGTNSYIVKPVTIQGYVDCFEGIRNYWLNINSMPV